MLYLKIGGYKLILDGSPQGRSAWMTEPYLQGEEDYCAYGTMKDEDVKRFALAQLHMIASIFVGHVYYWGDVHVKNFGEVRGNYISPARDAMDLGVSVNFHQDTPVTKPNMMHTVWCAVNRVSRGGAAIGKEQAVTVYEALKAVTINAAYQYGEEASKGSIRVGKRADLVILDKNPLQVPEVEIKDIQVLETMKDGERIYRKM